MAASPYIASTSAGESDDRLSRLPDWREIVAILMERAWLGVLAAAAVFLFFTFQARRQTPYYRSTATLLVETQIPKLLNYQDVMSFNLRSLEYFNTHLNALHSRTMIERALAQSGLARNPAFTPGAETPEARIEAARRLVQITPIEKSRMINIVVEHPDPAMASDFANALAQAYIEQELDNRMNSSLEAIEWLRQRSEEYRAKLEEGLLELQAYREQTGSVSLEEDQNIVIAKLKALNAELTSAQAERIEAETLWQSVQAQREQGVPPPQLAPLLNDGGVQSALDQWQTQQREVARLRRRYLERHPELQQAVELEQAYRARFDDAVADAMLTLEARYELLADQERSLQAALKAQEQEAFDLDRKLVRYNELKRNVEADQGIHQAVLARMKEASLSESQPTEIIRLVEEARPAKTPFRPNLRQAMLRGSVLGLALGIAAIWLFYYTDHRFRRNEEIERMFGLTVMATIPLIAERSLQRRGRITHFQPSGEVAESFRTLRASLTNREEVRSGAALMVTSAGPGEGKSLVASNLAISLAQDGRRTLLIGTDLRRPVLDRMFDMPKSQTGLAEVLANERGWTEALYRPDVPRLDILPSGRIPSNPSERLGRREFADLLREARERYDHVVVDAPPLLGLSDSLVLLPQMDAVLFVVRYGVTHGLMARHAMTRIETSGTPCLGCIMNGVNFKAMANYYYYRRYGGYAYAPPEASSESAAAE
ncbi:MAG TPA: polysaccharide biosynthesis tyrosine autokinase [Kiritimatiellia bacterium]|nr:polysaccharide biosynthesis tyrosine autokinase [Kiritimatiellia bacterium]